MKGVKEALKCFSDGELIAIADNSLSLAMAYRQERRENRKIEKEEFYALNRKFFNKYPTFSKTYENYNFMCLMSIGYIYISHIPKDFQSWPFATDEIKFKTESGHFLITKELYEKEIKLFYDKFRREISLLNKIKMYVSNKSEEMILANIHLEASYMHKKQFIKNIFK